MHINEHAVSFAAFSRFRTRNKPSPQNDPWSQGGTMLSLLGEDHCAQYA
jgi:hypothetical protein